MSELSSQSFYLEPSRLNQTAPLPISEIYKTIKGSNDDWGVEGYQVPKKCAVYITKEIKVPNAKKRDMFYDISKKEKEPSPITYAPSNEQVLKRYWDKATGRFRKAQRKTVIDEVMKLSPRVPGPGTYHVTERGQSEKPKYKIPLGIMDKAQGLSFLSSTEFYAEESPGSGRYFEKEEDREKAYTKRERKSPVFKYYAGKPEKKMEKQEVGPGYLKNLENSVKRSSTMRRSPNALFPKSNPPNAIHRRAATTKFVPGVGAYKDVEKAYTGHIVKRKERIPFISPYKFTRFSDAEAKNHNWVPGPGSYEIMPPMRKK
ncbi:unnamed protein product [Blepharisma stoltei]|uniref:Uncharacterized protein n=1 Tax=Blepharisma stoltei TaxID=1481888 RepID=A0AAU9JET5_9CILI|nr:unnamed protein product [Blepharisma stoltei]